VPSSHTYLRSSWSDWLKERRSKILQIPPLSRAFANGPSLGCFRTTVTTCSKIAFPSGGLLLPQVVTGMEDQKTVVTDDQNPAIKLYLMNSGARVFSIPWKLNFSYPAIDQ